MSEVLMHTERVSLYYKGLSRAALKDVNIEIRKGVSLGIVGESGSGKSSLIRTLLGLENISSGNVMYSGRDISQLNGREKQAFRRNVQMVFQDPFNSLNPRMRIGETLAEVFSVHRGFSKRDASAKAGEALDRVGIGAHLANRYPHELSGGQRQRVGIARALCVEPEIIFADEPVSALDVSIQAQILDLLMTLVKETGITLVMIAHDLAVVRYVCQEVAVMEEGRIVEKGSAQQIVDQPAHPYTQSLIAAVPDIDRLMNGGEL